jgi:hypothetical protein
MVGRSSTSTCAAVTPRDAARHFRCCVYSRCRDFQQVLDAEYLLMCILIC